ncbi:hypothetical protein [Dyella ginsengisoli]|uniref:EF-Tu C-terminal domain-related protein n=1 Tax=Dyella ginsengisoli TaxID=363848 RepID=UPI00034491D4|nr:hypothetical protein [Dyella ginsengisoli]
MDRCSTRIIGLVLAAVVSTAAIAAAPHWLDFPAGAPLRATVTLLPKQGDVGRETPIYTGYAPQLAFHPGTAEVTCRLDLGDSDDGLAPGATRTVGVKCDDVLKVREDKLSFSLFEGGRKVGEGVLLR